MNEDKMGEVSDGYHTFDELYEHRHSLFLALMRCLPYRSWLSRWHDDGTFFEGMFICGIDLPHAGGTVTYHLPDRLWNVAEATGAEWLEKAPKWDGHTSDDVLSRLIHFATFN